MTAQSAVMHRECKTKELHHQCDGNNNNSNNNGNAYMSSCDQVTAIVRVHSVHPVVKENAKWSPTLRQSHLLGP